MASDDTSKLEIESTQTRALLIAVIDGPDRGHSTTVVGGGLRIGSAPSCQLRLRDPTVSRIHCEVQAQRGSVRVVDAGSTNGTWTEGARVRDVDLTPGATFRIGATTLRVQTGEDLIEMPVSDRHLLGELVGGSLEMRRVYALIERVGPTDSTALIQGDTGTGKELVARALHEHSQRATKPFVFVDCGAIAPNVIESELFGHVRGAFSGAIVDRKGLFEEADGGTLFLDEIGELSLGLQAKLLRALETREIRRVGGNATRKVDVRVIAATHRPLARAVNEGTFRDDLYYRLAVVEFRLPPLHARRGDIPELARHFYRQLTRSDQPLPEELLSNLLTRSWPGNVRELRNFIERCVAVGLEPRVPDSAPKSRNVVRGLEALVPAHLPMKEARRAWMAQFESAYVRAQLERTQGNVTRAAEACGVSRRFFQRTMARLGLRSGSEEPADSDAPPASEAAPEEPD